MPKNPDEGESIFGRAVGHIVKQPVLVLVGAVAAIGGFLDVVFATGLNAGVSSVLLLTGLQIVGNVFLIHLIAFVVGFFLALLVILAISGFAQGIVLKVAGAHFHKEEDLWYGALRSAWKSMIPLMWVWILFYIVSGVAIVGIYRLGLLAISATSSTTAEIIISFLAIALIIFVLLLLAAIAMNASCFVSIFRLKTGKAIASGFDMFAQIPLRSVGVMLFLSIIWILSCAAIVAVFGIILFVGVWVAHFRTSSEHLVTFITGSHDQGLLITLLIGILLVTNAALTAFGDTAWALFFLEHVSTGQLPKPARRNQVRSIVYNMGD